MTGIVNNGVLESGWKSFFLVKNPPTRPCFCPAVSVLMKLLPEQSNEAKHRLHLHTSLWCFGDMCIVYFLFSFHSWKLCSFRHTTTCILLHRNLNWSTGIIKTDVKALPAGAMLLTCSGPLSGSTRHPLKLISVHCRTEPDKLKIRT
jgi:hypothetical protein